MPTVAVASVRDLVRTATPKLEASIYLMAGVLVRK